MVLAAPETAMILLCDNERSVRRLVCTILTRSGYQVLQARNGRHAMDIAGSHTDAIDLLLSDVMMPELDGPGLAERLRAIRPNVRVIFMSGDCGGLLVSFDGCPFLQKPFSPRALLQAVGDSLAQPSKPLRSRP
jgi:two-component system, cell cycle sensor histidine kinase and response regulator CckA